MKTEVIAIIAVSVLAFIAFVILVRKKQYENKIYELTDAWGKLPNKEFTYDEFETIRGLYDSYDDGSFCVDDITWDDLDMDKVFLMINNTHSSIGQENLYYMLRNAYQSEEVLKERDLYIDFFSKNKDKAVKLQYHLSQMGYTKKVSVYDYIQYAGTIKKTSNLVHYMCIILEIISILYMLFVEPISGVMAFLAVISFSMYNYYKTKNKNSSYINALNYIMSMLEAGKKISKENITKLDKYNKLFDEKNRIFAKISRNFWLISKNDVKDSLIDMIMDYVKIITHIDLIKFNHMIDCINDNSKELNELYSAIGGLEALIAVASYRAYLEYYTKPQFVEEKQFDAKDMYHPLIEEPVKNTISEKRSVLLTGSNASGKSTFLKTVAINALLAQSIYTCLAKEYKASIYKIISSMSLKDDIGSGESYYMVEIKALKRILDEINDDDMVMCFVDEVLRGTNTVERIAASSQILADISQKNALCFAATHDIELTTILEDKYSNYHFREEIINDDIFFSYNLYKGRATTRNAIKLLGIMGYSKEIIKASEDMATKFVEEGNWCKI
ncbi:MAG: hypothetical protein E7252_01095 [Lachnospira sp.]|nr:hypothetical protein [Lachnospira sp.]